jgi:predicted esterase
LFDPELNVGTEVSERAIMAFSDPHIHEPTAAHTHTIVFLHGRGGTGLDFSEELFETPTTLTGQSLQLTLPSVRWVFPTAKTSYTTAFQETLPSWFDVYSLTDPDARQELQSPGLRETVIHVLDLLDHEVARLGGRADKVLLGGMSQGMAVALHVLMQWQGRLGGFIGCSGWMPFAGVVNTIGNRSDVAGALQKALELHKPAAGEVGGWWETPVFLGHGSDDAWVDVELGRNVRDVLSGFGMSVVWKEYTGAEEEGHWLKEPEEFDDILVFFAGAAA